MYKFYCKRFYENKEQVTDDKIKLAMSESDITFNNLKSELLGNTIQFRLFAYNIAKQIVSCPSYNVYAAVVAKLCDNLSIDYTAYVGTALPEGSKGIEKVRQSVANNENYIYNHVFLIINGEYYEYFNGDTSNIIHFKEKEIK